MKVLDLIKSILFVTVLVTFLVGIPMQFILNKKLEMNREDAAKLSELQTQQSIPITMYRLCINGQVYLYQNPDFPEFGDFPLVKGARVECSGS